MQAVLRRSLRNICEYPKLPSKPGVCSILNVVREEVLQKPEGERGPDRKGHTAP